MFEAVEIMLCVILPWPEHSVEGDLPYIAPGAVRSVMQWGRPWSMREEREGDYAR